MANVNDAPLAPTVPALPEDVPVQMPDLPPMLTLRTAQQFKAIADPVRSRILGIIQHQPLTAKQLAVRLGLPPGTVGHHLGVLEAAGLAQVVARRSIHGIVAKYYTRTARIFGFDLERTVTGATTHSANMLAAGQNELAETLAAQGDCAVLATGLPHARLSASQVAAFSQRLNALIDEFISAPTAPDGQVYGLAVALYLAPPGLQADFRPESGSDRSESR